MFHFHRLNASRMDEGAQGPASFPKGQAEENFEDELEIISDQDLTSQESPNASDVKVGGMGTALDFGLGSNEFARGEIDLVEQIQRTTAAVDRATHRSIESARPGGPQSHVDTEQTISEAMSNRMGDEKRKHHPKNTHHGHSTGALTDIGAGKSGVTREADPEDSR